MLNIITSVVNDLFLETQYNMCKKYSLEDFRFIVFNDAKTPDESTKIYFTCYRLGIQSIPIQNGATGCPATLCANAMNFMLEYQRTTPGRYLVLDSDMIPVNYFKFGNEGVSIVLQERGGHPYFWNGLVFLNSTKINEMDMMCWNTLPGFDVGGAMILWMTATSTEKTFIKHLQSGQWDKNTNPFRGTDLDRWLENDPRNVDGQYFAELYDGKFLHVRCGSGWNPETSKYNSNLASSLKTLLTTWVSPQLSEVLLSP